MGQLIVSACIELILAAGVFLDSGICLEYLQLAKLGKTQRASASAPGHYLWETLDRRTSPVGSCFRFVRCLTVVRRRILGAVLDDRYMIMRFFPRFESCQRSFRISQC